MLPVQRNGKSLSKKYRLCWKRGEYRELFSDFRIFIFHRKLSRMVYGIVFQEIHLKEQSRQGVDKPGIPDRTISAAVRLRTVGHVSGISRHRIAGYRKGCYRYSGNFPDDGSGDDSDGIRRRTDICQRDELETLGLQQGKVQYPGDNMPQVYRHMGAAGDHLLFHSQQLRGRVGRLAVPASGVFLLRRDVLRHLFRGSVICAAVVGEDKEVCRGQSVGSEI